LLPWLPLLLFRHRAPTSDVYPRSLPDALPIYWFVAARLGGMDALEWMERYQIVAHIARRTPGEPHLAACTECGPTGALLVMPFQDRKSTRLNSSHAKTSYAVVCVEKKTHMIGG